MRRLYAPFLLVLLVASGGAVVVSQAATSTDSLAKPKQGRWSGKASPYDGQGRDSVDFRLTRSGQIRQVRGPSWCAGFPVVNRVHVSARRTFSTTRTYHDSAAPITWSVKFSGRFTSRTKARGKLEGTAHFPRGECVRHFTWRAHLWPCWPYECDDPDRPRQRAARP
jgi:hypothetical protein